MPDVKPKTCSELAVSASLAEGSTVMLPSSPDGIASVVAVAMLLSGMAAVSKPRMEAWSRAGTIARFFVWH